MQNTNEHIGLRIKELREEKNSTIRDFASSIGLDNSTLGKVEKGKMGISNDALMEIISKYGVSYEWLFSGKGPKYASEINDETEETLLLKIYQTCLTALAHGQANAEMIKEIYQVILGKDDIATKARYSALLSGFLIEGSKDQLLSGKKE